MQNMSRLRGLGAAAVFALLFLAGPSAAHAETNVQVRQVLPPSAQTCPVLGATDVTPYVYDGKLHSFDISITDDSYVALSASVGDEVVPFNFVSRRYDQQQGVRLHVDITPQPLYTDTAISITLLSAHPGGQSITCLATLTTVVPAAYSSGGQGSGTTGSAQTNQGYPWSNIQYGSGVSHAGNGQGTGGSQVVTGTPTATSTAPLVTATHSLGDTCGTKNGPVKLWAILLVLYALFVWLLASRRITSGSDDQDWNVALTVAGFLALLFFWYVSAACRTGSWAPILATIIACVGLIALTQSGTKGGGMLLLRDAQ